MAQFSESYFQEEIKSGFKIESMMKRAWAAQIEVLEEIDRICQKYGLIYYADWGTMLGAVRHGGFIPWDDDIDIAMNRTDYMKLIEIGQKELGGKGKILSIYTEETYTQAFMRVVNSDAISFNEDHLTKYHGCPYIVGVDIFPLDRLSTDINQREIHRKLLNMIYMTIEKINAGETAEIDIENIQKICQVKIDYNRNLKNQMLRLLDTVCQLFDKEDGKITEFVNDFGDRSYEFLPEWYDKRVWVPFETIQIPLPAGYDRILTEMYGNYMTPVFHGADHDYPFYKQQEAILYKYMNDLE